MVVNTGDAVQLDDGLVHLIASVYSDSAMTPCRNRTFPRTLSDWRRAEVVTCIECMARYGFVRMRDGTIGPPLTR